jgi:leader peptidase (prepilin peptidase) / N-methyltransferase
MSGLPFPEQIAGWPWAEAAVILCAAAWGGILGSFINVVVHRVPRGESVVAAGSRCPTCGTPIRPSDNIPVIGWLRLRGRCRRCGIAISPQYPLVEAGCSLAVAALAASELAGGGRWLPGFSDSFPTGIDRLLRGDWRLLLAFVVHAAAVLTVISWCLLDRSRWLLADGTLLIPLAMAVGLAVAVPEVGPPAALPQPLTPAVVGPGGGSLLAAVAGAAVGWAAGRCFSAAGIRLGLPLLGSVLGWQAVTVLAIVTAVAVWMGSARRAKPRSMQLVLPAAATLWICFWTAWLAIAGSLAAWLRGG